MGALHSVPSSCTVCQTVLIVSTSDKKYRFGVPFKVLTKQVEQYIHMYSCMNQHHPLWIFTILFIPCSLQVNEQIEKLRKSQVEKKLELREAATRRKLLALKQQFTNAQTTTHHSSTSSPPASSLSPSSQQNQSRIGPVTPILSPSDTPTRGELRSGPSAPISPPSGTSTHITTHRTSTAQSLPSTSVSNHSTSHSGPDTPFLSPTDTPSHSSSHTGPATPTLSPNYTPTHSTSRNGLAALRERLQVTSPNSDKTGKLHSSVSTSKDSRETPRRQQPVAIPEENKETQFLSQCQRQQERVSRIRRAMAAATLIQRAWRRYKQSHH